MGTNYYTKEKTCPTCKHTPTPIHLGKSSYGWQFSFQYNGGRFYKNVEEMREWLKGKKITDENGGQTSYEAFWRMVDEKQRNPENKNHAEYVHNTINTVRDNDFVIDGYSFSDCEFS